LNYYEVAVKVEEVYGELEDEVYRLKCKSNLKCIENCGHCCYKEDVEDTILSFIPLAIYLWEKNLSEYWLNRIKNSEYRGRCIFFEENTDIIDGGKCTIYEKRGLICRLFGFSGNLLKNGEKIFYPCKILKNKNSNAINKVNDMILNGEKIPIMSEYAYKLMSIDLDLATKRYPINTAIRYALEKVGNYFYYETEYKIESELLEEEAI